MDLFSKVLKDVLIEMSIHPKDAYAQGSQHDVYRNMKDPDKLFKVVNPDFADVSKQAYNWIKIFKEHPDLFPKVYRSNDRGAEVEKLDANKAKKEFVEVEKALAVKFEEYFFGDTLKDIADQTGDWKTKVKEAGEYLMQEDQRLASIFKKFVTLMIKLQPIASKEEAVDAHQGNFGYDKQGHLKMIDL